MQILGKEVNITVGSLAEVFALKLSLANALKDQGIKLDLSGFDLGSTMDKMQVGDIGGLVEMLLSVSTSEKVRACLFTLGGRCTIGTGEQKSKVSEEFFDNPDNWQYYYPVMGAIIKENLSPFFKGLSLASLIPPDLIEKVLGQK